MWKKLKSNKIKATSSLVIWVLLFTIVTASFQTSAPQFAQATPSSDAISLAASPQMTYVGADEALSQKDVDTALGKDKIVFQKHPLFLLPAWRWIFVSELKVLPGEPGKGFRGIFDKVGQTIQAAFSVLPSQVFSTAAQAWMYILYLFQYAMSTSLIEKGSTLLNSGLHSISGSIINSSIIFIIAAFILFRTFMNVIKGRVAASASMIVTFFITAGMYLVIFDMTQPKEGTNKSCNTLAELRSAECAASNSNSAFGDHSTKGTPAFLALKVINTSNDIAAVIPKTLSSAIEAGVTTASGSVDSMHCTRYKSTIYNLFDAVGSSDDANVPTWIKDANTRTILKELSLLWERSYFDLWAKAQFGTNPSLEAWKRASCHRAEVAMGVTPRIQAGTAHIAGYPDHYNLNMDTNKGADIKFIELGKHNNGFDLTGPFEGTRVVPGSWQPLEPDFPNEEFRGGKGSRDKDYLVYTRIFALGQSLPDQRANMIAWSICRKEKKEGHADFSLAPGMESLDAKFSGNIKPMCNAWYNMGVINVDQKDNADPFRWGKDVQGISPEVNDLYSTLSGGRYADATGFGMLSLFSATIYAFGLGGLAFGSLLAQIGMFVLIICLPITMIFLMLPNKTVGIRALKLTFTFTLYKFVTATALSLIVFTILAVQSLVGA